MRALIAPGSRDEDDVTLLNELLSLPSSAADLNFSPQRKREKLFEALLNQLEAEARRRPVLMVFEDAHWIGPTSRELLDLAVDRVGRLPVLLAVHGDNQGDFRIASPGMFPSGEPLPHLICSPTGSTWGATDGTLEHGDA